MCCSMAGVTIFEFESFADFNVCREFVGKYHFAQTDFCFFKSHMNLKASRFCLDFSAWQDYLSRQRKKKNRLVSFAKC